MGSVYAPLKLEHELERRVEQLTHLLEAAQAVVGELDLDPLLQRIADSATRLFDADWGGLLVPDEAGGPLQFVQASGWPAAPPGSPTAAGLDSLFCRAGDTLRLDDVRRHPHALDFSAHHPHVGPLLAVPLQRQRRVFGTLLVGNAPGGCGFSDGDEALLLAFADLAAIAVENARFYALAEDLARAQERQRIAGALHETVAQLLFTIGLEVESCLEHATLDGEARGRLGIIRRLVGRGRDELRSAIFALRGPFLPGGNGLVELLERQVVEFEAQSGVAATLIVPRRLPPVPRLIGEAIYRVVSESLSNVHKHAQASAVVVSLHCDDGALAVAIQDDGVGLAAPLPAAADDRELRFGVVTMRQVAGGAQGDLFIGANDDRGVTVKARFPMPESCHP
jgi:signal transduction histidine kinase